MYKCVVANLYILVSEIAIKVNFSKAYELLYRANESEGKSAVGLFQTLYTLCSYTGCYLIHN